MPPLAALAEPIWRAAIAAADPFRAVLRALPADAPALREARRIRVVGAGKAAAPMAAGALAALGERIAGGLLVAKRGGAPAGVGPIEIAVGGHPLPDEDGARAAARLLRLLRDGPGRDDLVLALLSGGGSSLLALPAEGLSLGDLRAASDSLILGGADIARLNAVRKHLTRLGGGQLARAAAPAPVLALIVSDVVGDPLDVIASGPTAPDPTTFADALAAIRGLGLEAGMPPPVLDRLRRGAAGEIDETPKPADPLFDRVDNRVVAGNATAVAAAADEARRLGLRAEVVTTELRGEARERGAELAALAGARAGDGPGCFLFGGETTVTVRGRGRGGRNQELALAAAMALEAGGATGACVAAISTDGEDGPTDAAGAIVDASTCARIRAAGIDPGKALDDNDSHAALDAAGALIRTGPTGTNVADLAFVLI